MHGHLPERLGAKTVILLGLVLSAVANVLFAYVDLLVLLIVIWGINGCAQSTGWPVVVKIMGSWFRSDFGTVGGFFG